MSPRRTEIDDRRRDPHRDEELWRRRQGREPPSRRRLPRARAWRPSVAAHQRCRPLPVAVALRLRRRTFFWGQAI